MFNVCWVTHTATVNTITSFFFFFFFFLSFLVSSSPSSSLRCPSSYSLGTECAPPARQKIRFDYKPRLFFTSQADIFAAAVLLPACVDDTFPSSFAWSSHRLYGNKIKCFLNFHVDVWQAYHAIGLHLVSANIFLSLRGLFPTC